MHARGRAPSVRPGPELRLDGVQLRAERPAAVDLQLVARRAHSCGHGTLVELEFPPDALRSRNDRASLVLRVAVACGRYRCS